MQVKKLRLAEKLAPIDPTRKGLQFEVVKDPIISGRRVKINVVKRIGFTPEQAARHQDAAAKAEIVINSLEFKNAVTKKKGFTSCDMNGTQVYDKFITGEEELQRGKDYEFDIEVTMYEENNSTVGYTYANKFMVWVNNKFFKQYTLGEIAGNMIHEYAHKQGFEHTSQYTDEREFSVPYWIGYLVRDMVDAYVKGTRYTDIYPSVSVITKPAPVVIDYPIKVPVKKTHWYDSVFNWFKF